MLSLWPVLTSHKRLLFHPTDIDKARRQLTAPSALLTGALAAAAAVGVLAALFSVSLQWP